MKLNMLWVVLLLLTGNQAVYASDWMNSLSDFGVQLPQNNQTKGHAKNQFNALSTSDMAKGLKDALKIGSGRVVKQLSRQNGFNSDTHIHIPLPDDLKRVKSLLQSVGAGSLMDDLELKLNRAAEAATPKAKGLFLDAIHSMSFQNVRAILNGPNDAATQYFKTKMSPALGREIKPVINRSLQQVGAIQAYNAVMGKYQSMPFVPNVQANLQEHVTQAALKGVFYYMAAEEAAIRKNPAKRTTAILKKVFLQR